jgi:TPR repeat protein
LDDEAPSFSPFPKVEAENIPPSNEQVEKTLLNTRHGVLHGNNVPAQIAWARDVLMWVEIGAEAAVREWKQKNKGRNRERPSTPKVEHDLRVDAVSIIQYLASQDHPEATFMKAKWQEFGKFGYREDKKEAYLGYKKAASMGWGRAEYRIGMLYENSNDNEKAVKHYNQGVALRDSAAYYRLGMMYLMGQHGYPRDTERGLEMIKIAADTADSDAPQGAYVYGMLIARELPDIDIPEFLLDVDLGLARQYIEKAAFLGFAKAQLKMGQAYELSQLGCDFAPALSLHYYALAAQQGQAEAALGVSRWFLFGYEKQFPKNEKLAFQYGEAAADAGLPTGEFAMGYYYEIGIHVPKDLRQARMWYERAAEHGNKDSVRRLEELEQSRTLSKKDHETTTLTRIKSQHGSQRGKRPERFSRPNEKMQTVSESPDDEARPAPPVKGPSPPRISPQPSLIPRKPVIVEDHVEFPDPERQSTMNNRPPAFTINIDQSLPVRPKSSAPYPEDDRPPPLNVSRPKSTAPYPEDDKPVVKPQLSPHFNPNIRPSSSSGPQADRPMSAFGIRPLASNNQSLQPTLDPRGRSSAAPVMVAGWEPQVPTGYRQPQPAQQQPRPASRYDPLPSQRLSTPGSIPPAGTTPPMADPNRHRLSKPNPTMDRPQPGPLTAAYGAQQRPSSVQPPYQADHPGRDYGVGPRISSRPVSDTYDRYGAVPPARIPPAGTSPTPPMVPPVGHHSSRVSSTSTSNPPYNLAANPYPDRIASTSTTSLPPAQQQPLNPRPNPTPAHLLDPSPGRSSAPPAQGALGNRPGPTPAQGAAGNGTHSLPAGAGIAHPDGKTMGQGPATFEEMGIPQGKNESDCVSTYPIKRTVNSDGDGVLTWRYAGCYVSWLAICLQHCWDGSGLPRIFIS